MRPTVGGMATDAVRVFGHVQQRPRQHGDRVHGNCRRRLAAKERKVGGGLRERQRSQWRGCSLALGQENED